MTVAATVQRSAAPATLFLAITACGILEPSGYAVAGAIISDGDTVSITMPDTVPAGESFQIVLATFAHGCTTTADRTERVVGVHVAEVLPYDWTKTGVICTSDPKPPINHGVRLQFDEPGHALVRIHGLELDDGWSTSPVFVDREVVVR